MLMVHRNVNLSDALFALLNNCVHFGILPEISINIYSFSYKLEINNKTQTGTVHQLRNHIGSRILAERDSRIIHLDMLKNYKIGNRMFKNYWVCEKCINGDNPVLVQWNETEKNLEAFCMHTNFMDDEVFSFANDESDSDTAASIN